MKKRFYFVAAIAILAGALSMAPASAAPGSMQVTRTPVASADAAVAATGCDVYRYGYHGIASCSSYILDVNWNPSGTARWESFVIAPTRTIYHAWPGSGGWKLMPGNGRADDTGSAWWSGSDRNVSVYVTGSGYYCTTDPAGSAGWNGWRRC